MKIGCDIDDVLFHLAPLMMDFLNKKYNKNVKLEEIESYYLEELFGIGYDELIAASVACSQIAHPVEDAVDVINSTMNYIHFISNRRIVDYARTAEHIVGLNLKPDWNLTHCDLGRINKYDLINEFNIHIFIEDRAQTVLDIVEYTDCTAFLFDRPWNKKVLQHNRIIRVNSWERIKGLLMKINEWEAVVEVHNEL